MLKGIRKLDMNSIILSTSKFYNEIVELFFMEFAPWL